MAHSFFKKISLILFCTLFFTSCIVTHSGNVSSGPLLNSNDTYARIASGKSKMIYVFGFGSLKNNQLVQKAKVNMYLNFPLHKNEYYSNYTTDINKKIIFGIVDFTRVTVSADILMVGTSDSLPFSDNFKRSVTPYIPLIKSEIASDTTKFNGAQLMNNDTVYYTYKNMGYQKYIVNSLDKETVILTAMGHNYPTILVPIKQNTFYIKNRSVADFSSGQTAKVRIPDPYNGAAIEKKALICGFCNNFVLLYLDKDFYSVKVSKLTK